MERSYQEVCRLLNAAHIDDVPVLHGCTAPLASPEDAPDCEAVEFLIQEALRDDPAPLYIAAQGAMTNIAAALNRAPEIASRMTVLWNGGGPYPAGRPEFNVQQDPIACRVLLDSAVTVWQIPQDVYARFEVSLAELALRVRPCGEVGAYLFQQLMDEYPSEYDPRFPLRTGGNWTLGDNTTAAVLLENGFRGHWTLRPAPVLLPSLTYAEASDRKPSASITIWMFVLHWKIFIPSWRCATPDKDHTKQQPPRPISLRGLLLCNSAVTAAVQ